VPAPRLRPTLGLAAVAAAALVAVALVPACTSRPTATERRAELVRDARSSIGDYVADLDRGDLAGADALRCHAARLPPEAQRAYLGPVVDELKAALGHLRVASLELVNSIAGVTHVTVRLAGAPAPTHPALVEEDGKLRLCGSSIDGAAELWASNKTREGSDTPSGVPLDQLVGVAPLAGYQRQDGDAVPPGLLDQLVGFVDARGSVWDGPEGRTVSITVVDLDTAAHAKAAQRVLEGDFQDDVTSIIDGPSPAARGFQYLAGYQLFLQPPGVGSYGAYIGLRWGSRIAAVYVQPLPAGEGTDVVRAVAGELAAAA
jgi:hypothetical protein